MTPFVHEWFSATAAARGRAVAIDAGPRTLSYDELERESNRVAHALVAAVPRGSLVGILADDPIAIVTAMIAILKAGCAFVPMEPAAGDGRLALLAREIDLSWWIVEPSLVEKLGSISQRAGRRFRALCPGASATSAAAFNDDGIDDGRIDDDRIDLLPIAPDADATPCVVPRPPDDLCYVYFTSGSTGQPKGIAGRLKAIDHFVRWEMGALGTSSDVRVSQLTSPVFDAFLRDVFLPLCAGGVLCVPPDRGIRADARRLMAWLRDSRVTVVHCVPSVLRPLLQVPDEESRLPDLRHVLTSGEALLPIDVRAWMSRYGAHARLTNLYGPSETTMVKFAYVVAPADGDRPRIPIGTPIDGTRAIVVGERGQVCPPGKTGEIYIRTPYRSLGYYGRSDLTNEVFVPNPFGSDPGDLVYRTGDLGRVLEDGQYDLLGRRDHQVKIRGVRVELSEIELAIRREPRVQDCSVIARDQDDGTKTLCAFVVLRDGLTRRQLAERTHDLLPEYMMPAFVEVDALPRTPSGKVDRQALDALAAAGVPLADDEGAPRTPVEEIVAAVWAHALGVDRLHVHQDFFQELGGHSLLATQVLVRLQPLFDVPLKLRWLFEAPTVATFSACIDRELRQVGEESEPEPVLERVASGVPLPLSFGQERLWIVDQVTGTRAYHVPLALTLTGALDAAALIAAVTALAARHEVLRTTIGLIDGQPMQQVAPPHAVPLPWIDLSGIPEAGRTRLRRAALRAYEAARFDLRAGPLWRAAVLRLAPDHHVLACTLHHIAADGWSIGLLLRDLSALYEAARTGEAANLPILSVQYGDYAVWQRHALSGVRQQAQLAYWRTQLAAVSPLALPTDRPRRPIPSARGAVAWRRWPAELAGRVQQWGRAQGATLFMMLLASWQALLARYASQQDVAVGVPVTQRPRVELEPLIGFFLNTVVLRTQVIGRESWRSLIMQVRGHALAAYAHQLVPFEQVIAALQPDRDLSRTPLFQVLLVLQNLPAPGVQPSALRLDVLEPESAGAKFDLELGVKSRGDELTCRLEYAADLFDRATIDRMLGHLETLIDAAINHPDVPLEELSCLTPAERTQIVRAWNATDTAWPGETDGETAVAWMEGQAARTPDAVAVHADGESWSYAQLHADANRIARRLHVLGVRPESRVGIWLQRSPRMVAALLGTMKAGAAYVPLDPAYPSARLAFQLEDARVRLVLTDAASVAAIPEGPYLVDVLDTPDPWWRYEDPTTPTGRAALAPTQLAYIIYTSGSTGRPKGAMNTHAGLINRLRWMGTQYAVTPDDRILQKTSIGFDVSVWELFLPLVNGAALVLTRPGGQQDPSYLSVLIARERVTVSHFVPSMLEAFVAAGGLASCESLRLLVSSGEALPGPLAARVRAAWPGQLENLYGPTEASVDVTTHPCDDVAAAVVPIGRPVANTQIYLLDRSGAPVPISVVGELCIGGIQVGRGYWRRPDLTAASFTPDPFGDTPGSRLYRTGDLARYRADGVVEYVGRADHQIKLRGHRIELGEIEAALRQQPEIRDAAVVLRGTEAGGPRLVAFVVYEHTSAPPVDILQQRLRIQLPDHMVPAAIVPLDALPLTQSGKIDRRALPAGPAERPALAVAYATPRNEIEAALTRLWSEVLRLPHVGIHDNFFALGGDSILSLQIVARAHEAGLHVLPQQVFQFQTIAELALVARHLPTRVESRLAEGTPLDIEVPLTPIQRWFFALEPVAPHHFNQAVLLAGGPDLPPRAWDAIVAALMSHHDALRLRITRHGDEWRQRYARAEAHRVFLQVDLTVAGASSPAVLSRAAERVQRSLDLADGPIVRVVSFRGAGRESDRLLIVSHHAAIDGVSWRTLVEDLHHASAQWMRGLPIVLRQKTTSFLRWAERLAARAYGADTGVDSVSDGRARLPLDYPSDDQMVRNTIRSQRSHRVTLTPAETQMFLQQPPRAYRMHAHEVLIAAVASALADWVGTGDVRLALEGHGRDALGDADDVSRTVGCFTTLYPVSVRMTGEMSAAEPGALLMSVKEQLRHAQRLAADAVTDGEAAPEVLVNYFGQFDQVLDETGWRLTPESAGSSRRAAGRRPFIVEINGGVVAGCLRVTIGYSVNLHREETIAALGDRFAAHVRAFVAHCQAVSWTQTTPSDIMMAGLTQAELDSFARIGGEIEDVYPLSPMQEGLLFHSVFEPDRALYFQQFRVTLEGDLDAAAFQQAWSHVIARHAILRTAFDWEERRRPLQIVYARVPLACDLLDLRGLAADARTASLTAYLEADRTRGFRLDRVPLLRLALVRSEDRRWDVVWSYHHILIDGWCVPLVFKEVATVYEALRAGRDPGLPPVARFSQYIAWLQRQDRARAKAYWRGLLEGYDEPTAFLPHPRAVTQSAAPSEYDHRTRVVSAATVAGIQELARREHLTVNTVVQGAWALLLARYAGTHDVIFGATSSGRPTALAGVEEMIGLFINTLPVRVRVTRGARAVPWLQSLQAAQAEAREYEYTPLADIQTWSGVPRGVPLFESILAFENYPVDDAVVRGQASFSIAAAQVFEQTNYPITVQVSPASGLSIRVLFDGRRLDGGAAERMLAHFETLLAGLAAQDTARLDDLPLIEAAERDQVVRAWNAGPALSKEWTALRDGLLIDTLEAQAAATPDAVAVVADDVSVSYGTLHARADQWARRLQAEGVGPDVPVAVCVEPGAALITALLAVWKAHGAYVPLEPRAPSDRHSYIVRDVGARVLIASRALGEKVGMPELRVIDVDDTNHAHDDCYDDARQELTSAPRDMRARASAVSADNVAYVIYTSGSTGRPKGVAVTHGNVTSLFAGTAHLIPCAADDVWTLFHSAAFDFSVWEMWGALHSGGRLVVVPYATARTPESMVSLARREQVTVLNQTPSAFRGFMAADSIAADGGALPLRTIIFGGEALDPRLLHEWVERHGLTRPALINMYGITETTVHVTHHPVTASDVAAASSRIGRSLPSLQVYVRDLTGQAAPTGVAGELFVGGAGVARGYVGRPELTAERFVPDPFSLTPGSRLYRTGDRARWQPDGVLEYCGRLDAQIKLRGYRIEPGEIEAVLRHHPNVRDAVVILREDAPGEKRLVAYVVAQATTPAAQSDRAAAHDWEQQITEWESVFERNYAASDAQPDPTFNIAGWNASDTGLPIPADEMREWVDETVSDILSIRPARVLEIGCGTGLLLLRVAPHCEAYVGTDISQAALDHVTRQLAPAGLAGKVTLRQQAADDLDGLPDDPVDLVILNSVVQYFPSADYLTRVLERVIARLAPGGRIFIGDVRSLPLLRMFHQAVQIRQAPEWLTLRAFERRIERQVHQETELVLSPEFFRRLADTLPSIEHVEIRPKLGAALNELTKFRYHVVLHVGGTSPRRSSPADVDPVWMDWRRDALTMTGVRRLLQETSPAALGVAGVPNARLAWDVAVASALAAAAEDVTLDEVRGAIASDGAGVHPRDLLAVARDTRYAAALDWSRHGADGAFDVVFTPIDAAGASTRPRRPDGVRDDSIAVANQPLLAQAELNLGPVLRRFAQERLPAYMAPAAFVVLDRLPVTSNGKLDRRALAPPDFARPELGQAYVAPRTPLERELARIWAEGLRVQQVGVHDNFFELGGDSIISIHLVARANRAGVPLTPKLLFEHPTIAQIAAHADEWQVGARETGDDTDAASRRTNETASSDAAAAAAAMTPARRRPRAPRYETFSLAGLSNTDIRRELGIERAIEDAYPLSPMQQGMLFHSVDAPESGVYVAQLCYTLTGDDVDIPALRAAWQGVMGHHAALRTAFVWDRTPTPLQLVFRDVDLPWDERDWRGVPELERRERIRALLEADRRRGFDFRQPPLMRLTLIRTATDTWELIWSHHHLLLDGWSLPIVSREVLDSYDALRRGGRAALAPSVPYSSYIAWLQQQDEAAAERYWRTYLRDMSSLHLPRNAAASSPSSSGADGSAAASESLRVLVSTRKTAAVKRWARTRQLTLHTLLQGLWALAMGRVGGSDDVIFGGVVSGRPAALAGSERCVGLFINTLPVRVQVHPGENLVDWLLALQAQQVVQRQFEFVPLLKIKRWSDGAADAPLFETLLVFENYPIEPMRRNGGRHAVRSAAYHMTESAPLVLSVGPGRQLVLELKYDGRRLEAAWVQQLAVMLEAALDVIVRQTVTRIAEVLRAMQRAEDDTRAAAEARGEQTMSELLGMLKQTAARRSTRRRRESGTPRL